MGADSDDVEADSDADSDTDAGGGPTCPHCGGHLFKRHCKYVCPQHGVVFDCADTFWHRE